MIISNICLDLARSSISDTSLPSLICYENSLTQTHPLTNHVDSISVDSYLHVTENSGEASGLSATASGKTAIIASVDAAWQKRGNQKCYNSMSGEKPLTILNYFLLALRTHFFLNICHRSHESKK